MLTIEQLRAMPPTVRESYLLQCDKQVAKYEREVERLLGAAADLRADARAYKERADANAAAAAKSRAYFATLEAAGMWPLPPGPTGAVK